MRLLIIDDHEVVREGLRAVLTGEDMIDVVDEASNGASALELARRFPPDIALVDYKLPDMTGDVLCRELRVRFRAVRLVMVTTYLNEDIVRRSLNAGANAYVTKDAGLGELRRVIAEVAARSADQAPQDWEVLQRLDKAVADRTADLRLTARQVRVLELIAVGRTYKQVAQQLYISQSTVRFHVQNLKTRLNVTTTTELVAKAIRLSLISPTAEAP